MRKHFFKAALLALAATALFAISAQAAYSAIGKVNATSLRLREQPALSGSILATADQGDLVTVLHEELIINSDGEWYQVTYKNLTGYMSAEYLDVTDATDTVAGYVQITGTTVNFRSSPSESSEVTQVLKQGTILDLIGMEGVWIQATYGGLTGYVHSSYAVITSDKPTTVAVAEKSTTTNDRAVATAALNAASPNAEQRKIVEYGLQYLGCKYVYGSSNGKTFDCSGFTSWVYNHNGYSISRTASEQYKNNGSKVSSVSELRPGDLVCFRDRAISNKTITHIGMYIGGGKFVHAGSGSSGAGRCVKVSDLSSGYYRNIFVCGKRIVSND